jgi:mono/diheme cytochrome c family protein
MARRQAPDKAPVVAAAQLRHGRLRQRPQVSGSPGAVHSRGNCTTCHTLDRVKTKHFDKESWSGLIDSMRGKRGGPKDLTDDQIQELADYLSKNFGPSAQ